MRILFIAPPSNTTGGNKRVYPRFPPFVLVHTASQLMHAGYTVKVYDAYLLNATFDDIVAECIDFKPDLIAFCPADITRFSPIEVSVALVGMVKRTCPSALCIFLGMRDVSLATKLMQSVTAIDYFIVGDPEETLLAMVKAYAEARVLSAVPGILMRDDAGFVRQIGNERVTHDLDTLRHVAWELVPLERYYFMPHRYKKKEMYPMIASRGCPWNRCEFCREYTIMKASPYRVRSAADVVAEIRRAIRVYGAREIQFFDAHFHADVVWLQEFVDEIKRHALSFSWSCLCRADALTDDVVRLMRMAGCWNVVIGIESSSQEMLDRMNKGLSRERIEQAIAACRKYGIEITGNFLLGLPDERPEDIIASARFAVEQGIDYSAFFIAKWYDRADVPANKGRLHDVWDDSRYDFRGYVFVPHAYNDIKHLKSVQRKAYRMFYCHPKTVWRRLRKVRSLRDMQRAMAGSKVLLELLRGSSLLRLFSETARAYE